MLTRRNLLTMAAAAPLSGGLSRGLAMAAEAKKQIKITGLETDLLRVPAAPYSDAIHDFGGDGGGVVLRLRTDAGITGWGYSSFGMIAGGPRVVQTILEQEIKPVLMGQDRAFPKRIRDDLLRALEYQGVQGVTQFAMSVVDIAVWDILGKAAGLPVYKMLGAVRDRMPAYAMCGWYRENDKDHSQYKRTINETLQIGYRAFKVKVGRFDLDDDVERIEVGFKTAGKGVRIMVDANQAYNRAEALRRGRAYQQLGCFWPVLLYSLTIFLSAFLLFQVQPIIAKTILPWFGGSSAVWSTCMLFFQVVLLLGYLYAHWLHEKLAPRRQAVAHIAALAVSFAALPILPNPVWKSAGVAHPSLTILALLSLTVGLPYFLLASTSPLLQAWYARTHREGMPYRLFALSNFASMLALLSYPFLVEPNLPTRMQGLIWSAAYVCFAALCGATAWRSSA